MKKYIYRFNYNYNVYETIVAYDNDEDAVQEFIEYWETQDEGAPETDEEYIDWREDIEAHLDWEKIEE